MMCALITIFDTPAARVAYLGSIMLDEIEADHGTTEQHARTAKPGLWADRARLRADCAIIFAQELQLYMEMCDLRNPVSEYADLAQILLAVPQFSRLFELWRRELEWNAGRELAEALGQSPPSPLEDLSDEDEVLLNDPHGIIYEQLAVFVQVMLLDGPR